MEVILYASSSVARAIFLGVYLPEDPRTFRSWAEGIFKSETQLRVACTRAKVRGRDAAGLVRILRACRVRLETGCSWEDALDVSESGTLMKLLKRGGLESRCPSSLEECLDRQAFVQSPAVLRLIRELLSGGERKDGTRG